MDDLDLRHGILNQVPIEVFISVGRARPTVRELVKLRKNAVLVLDRRVDDPVELFIGDKLVARGQLQELEGEQAGYLGVRLTEIIDLRDAL